MRRGFVVMVSVLALASIAVVWRALGDGPMVPLSWGRPDPASSAPAGEHGFGFAPTVIKPGIFDRAAPGYGAVTTFRERKRNGTLINREARKPQFSGWIGGVFIKGDLNWDEVPVEADPPKSHCGHTTVPPAELAIPAPADPPPGFTEIGAQSANLCGDEVSSVDRSWVFDGTSVEFNVIRYFDRLAVNTSATRSRIRLGSLTGRTAVYIDPITSQGVGKSAIIVAEGKGFWGFQGIGMRMADLRTLAEAVYCDNGRRCAGPS